MVVISHKHKFIFIKTRRCATSSIEYALAQICGAKDIVTDHTNRNPPSDRNTRGWFNPLPDVSFSLHRAHEIGYTCLGQLKVDLLRFLRREKYYDHIPAEVVKARLGSKWDNYFKFTVERNPWDKEVSYYYHRKYAEGFGDLTFEEHLKSPCTDVALYTNRKGRLLVDYVMRYERLQEDFEYVLNKLDLPHVELPHVNTHGKREINYRKFYMGENERFIDVVAKIHAKEIEMFGYEF
jgi:hypothetical protein